MHVQTKRVYVPPAADDGFRVLVDRLWPRGIKKAAAALDLWAKELAPSSELRKWFGHEDAKFEEFTRRYQLELADKTAEVAKLIASAQGRTITLLYAAKNTRSNHALVLKDWLQSFKPK